MEKPEDTCSNGTESNMTGFNPSYIGQGDSILSLLPDTVHKVLDIAPFLHNEGVIAAGIPNVRHYTTIMALAFGGYWPYRDRGIHDRTHLSFFTLRNINEMFTGAGVEIVRRERAYRIIETEPEGVFKYLSYLNRFSKYSSIPFLKNFLTFQYLVIAKKN